MTFSKGNKVCMHVIGLQSRIILSLTLTLTQHYWSGLDTHANN